jgi:fructose-bisphosphate aldolase class II
VLSAAQETNTPVILGVSEGAAKYMCGFKNVVDMVNNVMNSMNITQPIALHLDHGSFEGAKAALAAGFSSVMYDGSHLPFEENIKETQVIIDLANKQNASVEAEVGAIGGEEDGKKSGGELADVEQCRKISQLPIACLAAGIGNIHGIYPSD